MATINDIRKELCEKYGEQLQSVMDIVGDWVEIGDEILGSLLLNIIEEADLLRQGSYETVLKDKKSLTSVTTLMGSYHDSPEILGKLGLIYWKLEDIRSELAIKLGVEKPQTYIK
jgi:hypothetical protein